MSQLQESYPLWVVRQFDLRRLFLNILFLLFHCIILKRLLLQFHHLLLSLSLRGRLLRYPLLDILRLRRGISWLPLTPLLQLLYSSLTILIDLEDVVELPTIDRLVACLKLDRPPVGEVDEIAEVAVKVRGAPHHLQVDPLHQLTEHG